MTAETVDSVRVREQLERLLASSGFARNPRMSRFLRVVVERRLDGKSDELKESVIAVDVFGRPPDYDPKLDSIVRTEASRLRGRLAEYYAGAGAADPIVIEVPKGGYVPAFHVRLSRGPATIRSASEPPHADRRSLPVAIAAVAAAAAIVALALYGPRWFRVADPITIAVLPLQNLSPESFGDYFADGLTDEVIRNLSVIDGLSVRSRTSSFAFKGLAQPVRQVARQLDVTYVLEGSVFRQGNQLRVDAQLVHAEDDAAVWSARFDRHLTDVFAIQDDLAVGIVNKLRLKLGRGRRRYETSVDAYDLYLKGRATGWRRLADVRDAAHSFERAIEKDRLFAPAFAGLASATAIQSAQFGEPETDLDAVLKAAQRAIELDPLLAEAHEALAMVHARQGRWKLSEQEFEHAIQLEPHAARTRFDFAMWLLYVLGRTDEGLQQLRSAARVDPLSSDIQHGLATLLMSKGQFDEAATHCTRMGSDDPFRNQCIARVHLAKDRPGAAVDVLAQDSERLSNPQVRGFLGYAYARVGNRAEAEQMARQSTFPNEQAFIYAGLGDRTRTVDALMRMDGAGPQRVGRYLNYPEFDFVRNDPSVAELRARLGLRP